MKKFIVLGGDDRTKYTAQHLTSNGFDTITTNNFNGFWNADAVVLPLPFTTDNVHIKGTNVPIDDFCNNLSNSTIVFAGKLNKKAENIFNNRKIEFYDYNSREEFAQKNAVPTAQGVLTFVLNNVEVTLNSLKVAVTGYGKCGKSICKTFKNQGSEVISFSRRYTTVADAESDGLSAFLFKDINNKIKDADIVINTVPEKILNKEFIDNLSGNSILIDVASFPYGFDIDYAESINKKINILSSLPGKYVPKTAGIIIAETIINIIEEGGLWKK